MDITETVRNLIAKNKLDEALESFLEWARRNDKADIKDQLTENQRKFANLKRQENMGILTFSEANTEKAKISFILLELLKEVGQERRIIPEEPVKEHRILFLASNPVNTTELQLAEEFSKIARALQDHFQVKSEWAVTPSALQDAILRYKPQIIHFSGHGAQDENSFRQDGRALAPRKDSPQNGIVLQNDAGLGIVVSGQLLQDLFKIFTKKFKIEAVILNACYSEEQAVKIAQHVPYVIGTNESIPDSMAIKFAKEFYGKMAIENDVEYAFDLAKNVLSMYGDESDILVLYKNGTLYES